MNALNKIYKHSYDTCNPSCRRMRENRQSRCKIIQSKSERRLSHIVYNRYNETKAVYREPMQGRPRKTTEEKLQQKLRPPRRFLIAPHIIENWCLE